jgi:hypothetical protein
MKDFTTKKHFIFIPFYMIKALIFITPFLKNNGCKILVFNTGHKYWFFNIYNR